MGPACETSQSLGQRVHQGLLREDGAGVPRLGSSEGPPPPSPLSPPPAATCWAAAAAAVISPAQPPVTGTFLSTLELLQETTPSASHDSASPAHTTPARLGDPGHRGAAGAGRGGTSQHPLVCAHLPGVCARHAGTPRPHLASPVSGWSAATGASCRPGKAGH